MIVGSWQIRSEVGRWGQQSFLRTSQQPLHIPRVQTLSRLNKPHVNETSDFIPLHLLMMQKAPDVSRPRLYTQHRLSL